MLICSAVSPHAAGRAHVPAPFSFFRRRKENNLILLNNTSCQQENEEKNPAAAMSRFPAEEQPSNVGC
jgi:hypothetical protein